MKRKYNASTGRDYSYDRAYNKKTIKQRSQRNKARREVFNMLEEKYGASKAKAMMKGKDVDHIKSIRKGGANTKSNLRLLTPAKNRGDKKR